MTQEDDLLTKSAVSLTMWLPFNNSCVSCDATHWLRPPTAYDALAWMFLNVTMGLCDLQVVRSFAANVAFGPIHIGIALANSVFLKKNLYSPCQFSMSFKLRWVVDA